jgi:mono/diheme cytochrome c family protein
MATLLIVMACSSCGDEGGGTTDRRTGPPGGGGAPAASEQGQSSANMIKPADIQLGDIDQGLVAEGRSIYDVKCQACHSTGPNRIVGPGWKGITERREPHWIMNMILNIDVMLATDEEAQRQLEECLVRMPNQGLSKDEGRQVLEYMRTL